MSEKPVVPGYTYCEKCDIFFRTEEVIPIEEASQNPKVVLSVTDLYPCPLCRLRHKVLVASISAVQAQKNFKVVSSYKKVLDKK